MRTVKDEAVRVKLKYFERVIGQALKEGATPESVDAYLTSQGVADPDLWRARVQAKKHVPMLGSVELTQLGGRNTFRTLFGLDQIVEEPEQPYDFPLTESGDAELFAEQYADDLRFDHLRGRWLLSDHVSGLWIPDDIHHVTNMALDVIRLRGERGMLLKDFAQRKAMVTWAINGESRARLSNLLELAKKKPPISDNGKHWDEDPWLLGCRNGVVDLRTGVLRRAEPSEHITMQVRIAFDPTATCPVWMDSLQGIFSQEDQEEAQKVIDFFHRAMGYSITGDCREECCFFAYGEGANGKGTLMNTIGHLLLDYVDDMPYSTLERNIHGGGIPNDVAKMAGKRFITCSEVNEFTLNESRLKAITGRDPMTARFLNKEFFTFQPVGKIWIATNNKPRVTGTDDGIWRRIHLIPFLNKFEGANRNLGLKDYLRDHELPGVLVWLVNGVRLWLERGLDPPSTVKVATEAYRQESEPMQPFIDTCCVVNERASAQSSALWTEYQRWLSLQNDVSRLSDKAFGKALSRRFHKEERRVGPNRTGQTFYLGIGLRERGDAGTGPEF